MELLGLLRQDGKLDRVLTVAQELGPVPSSQGPATVAEYSFDDCPDMEVLVVPGGQGTRREVYNEILLQFLRDQYEKQSVQYIFSVCTGAALLAASGILNDCRATTNKISFDWVVSNDKSQRVVWINSNARWVLHGRILTSAGVSAGMDAALALISTTWSRHVAEDVARRAEYVWVSSGDENT